MNDTPDWLPDLITFSGEWESFVDEVYGRFCDDFVRNKVGYEGLRVSVRRHPESLGRGFGFWHCVSAGGLEEERIPDIERCRRIGWIRAILENANDPEIVHWNNLRGSEICHLLWFREEYLVVLAERNGYFLLKTAYLTDRNHTCIRLCKDRDRAKKG